MYIRSMLSPLVGKLLLCSAYENEALFNVYLHSRFGEKTLESFRVISNSRVLTDFPENRAILSKSG